MKRIAALFIVTATFVACNNSPQTADAPVADTIKSTGGKVDSITSKYIRKFEIGNPALAQKVFDFYSNYDANTLGTAVADFADTVTLDLAEGKHLILSRDSLIEYFKKQRGTLQTCLHVPDAFVALNNTNQEGSWVTLWERLSVTVNNKKDSLLLNENWKFDKDGKMVFLRQYAKKFAPEAK